MTPEQSPLLAESPLNEILDELYRRFPGGVVFAGGVLGKPGDEQEGFLTNWRGGTCQALGLAYLIDVRVRALLTEADRAGMTSPPAQPPQASP